MLYTSLIVKICINYPQGNNHREANEVYSVVHSYHDGK